LTKLRSFSSGGQRVPFFSQTVFRLVSFAVSPLLPAGGMAPCRRTCYGTRCFLPFDDSTLPSLSHFCCAGCRTAATLSPLERGPPLEWFSLAPHPYPPGDIFPHHFLGRAGFFFSFWQHPCLSFFGSVFPCLDEPAFLFPGAPSHDGILCAATSRL